MPHLGMLVGMWNVGENRAKCVDIETVKNSLHDEHRARTRKRFREEGLDSFEDHQVLELLLFFAIPRRDTNELAHGLLQRYGSLAGVLEADSADLERTAGIGANAATLLSLMPALTRRYSVDWSPARATT